MIKIILIVRQGGMVYIRELLIKLNRSVLFKAVVSLGLLAWLLGHLDIDQLIGVLTAINWYWLVAAVLFIEISIVLSVLKWQIVLRAQRMSVSAIDLWRAYWTGLFFNNFLPSSIGGDALRIVWVGTLSRDTAGAANSVLVERILATTGMGLTGLIGAYLTTRPSVTVVALYSLLVVVSIVLMAMVMGLPLPKRFREKEGRVARFIREFSLHGRRLSGRIKELLLVVLVSVIFHLSVVAICYCIFQALGLKMGVIESIYVVPLTIAAAMVPLGINGYGLREGTYISLLSVYGISGSQAFASSVLFALLVSFCSIYGAWVWLRGKTTSSAIRLEE